MKWIASYTMVVGVSTIRVDYCPKGDPVLSAQNNKINQSSLLVHWLNYGVHLYVFIFRLFQKNDVQLIFYIFIYLLIYRPVFSSFFVTARDIIAKHR